MQRRKASEIFSVLIKDEDLIRLKKEGKTIEKIQKYYMNEMGILPSIPYITKRCKEAFSKSEEQFPIRYTEKSSIDSDRIFYLRQQGKTYPEIAEILNKEGILIGATRVREIYFRICKQKGIKPEKLNSSGITDEDIIKAAQIPGMNFAKMAEYFTKKGKPITKQALWERAQKMHTEGKFDGIRRGKTDKER